MICVGVGLLRSGALLVGAKAAKRGVNPGAVLPNWFPPIKSMTVLRRKMVLLAILVLLLCGKCLGFLQHRAGLTRSHCRVIRPSGMTGPAASLLRDRKDIVRRNVVETVNAVELYGPVFAFAIGISIGGYGFAWIIAQIIEKTDSYEALGNLLAGEEEKQAYEKELEDQRRRAEEEKAAPVVLTEEEKLVEKELEEYRDY